MTALERLIESKKARQQAAAEQIEAGKVDNYLGSKISVVKSEKIGRTADQNLKDLMGLLD